MSKTKTSSDIHDFEGRTVGLMTTMYSSESPRLPLALKAMKGYREADIPAVAVDASPETEVIDRFREMGVIVLTAAELGVKPEALKLATAAVMGAKFIRRQGGDRIIKHEPEKDMAQFKRPISEALDNNDVVVVGRTPRAMWSLPTTQRQTETTGGRLMQEYLDFPADALSGGRAYARQGTDELINYDMEKWGDNWMHLHIPVLEAKRKGISVGGIQVDLEHPETMRAEEEGNIDFDKKRIMQLGLHAQLIDNYLREHPGTDSQ